MPESLRDVLEDIQQKLKANAYQNEEHVRLSLVARVVQALGWDIWNPAVVNAEFAIRTLQDANRRSDLALLDGDNKRLVFIEVKKVGALSRNEPQWINQIRSHNEDFRAPFAVLTDGRFWWLYFIYSAYSFEDSRFKIIDLIEGDLEDIELSFTTFLSRDEIVTERAHISAKNELHKSRTLKKLEELVPEAKRIADEDGSIAPVAVLLELMASKNEQATQEQAEEAYKNWRTRGTKQAQHPIKQAEQSSPINTPAKAQTLDSGKFIDLPELPMFFPSRGVVFAAFILMNRPQGVIVDELKELLQANGYNNWKSYQTPISHFIKDGSSRPPKLPSYIYRLKDGKRSGKDVYKLWHEIHSKWLCDVPPNAWIISE